HTERPMIGATPSISLKHAFPNMSKGLTKRCSRRLPGVMFTMSILASVSQLAATLRVPEPRLILFSLDVDAAGMTFVLIRRLLYAAALGITLIAVIATELTAARGHQVP